ncbi:hypothetical protein BH20VER1_BH20VER1_02840 [soil metagenome]
MKKIALTLSIVALGFTGFASHASAQRYSDRPVISVQVPRGLVPGVRDRRAAAELEQLNREVRRTREDIRTSRRGNDRRIRARFARVQRSTDLLNQGFTRGRFSGREVRVRAQQIRSEIREIQNDLRSRGGRGGRGRW